MYRDYSHKFYDTILTPVVKSICADWGFEVYECNGRAS